MQFWPTKTQFAYHFLSPKNYPQPSVLFVPMAKTILRSNHHLTVCCVLGLFSLLMLIQKGGAFEYTVGGTNGWTVPSNQNPVSYNQWAEKKRFQIGDTLGKIDRLPLHLFLAFFGYVFRCFLPTRPLIQFIRHIFVPFVCFSSPFVQQVLYS